MHLKPLRSPVDRRPPQEQPLPVRMAASAAYERNRDWRREALVRAQASRQQSDL